MKKIIFTLLFVSGIAQAQLIGNIGGTSDYRFRGISQTQKSAALQGGIDYSYKSGFYVGNWNTNVSSLVYTDSTGLESDLYGGFKKEIVKGVSIDVGTYNYFYSQATNKFLSNANTREMYLGVSSGPVSVKYSRSLGDYFGATNSKGSQYFQADLTYPIASKLTADAHYGRTIVANHSTSGYDDVKVGATYNLSGYKIGAHYFTNRGLSEAAKTANTISGEKLYTNQFVVSVAKSF
jgi:uncharacterized protein (TIGR02001 family)